MKKILLILFCAIAVAACSSKSDPFSAYRDQSEPELFQAAEKDMAHQHYTDAKREFEALDALYPFGLNTETAQLDIIYVYYQTQDLELAGTAADRYLNLYPLSANADYALYMRGVVNFQKGLGWLQRVFNCNPATRNVAHFKKAFRDFKMLVRQYPNSIYRDDAVHRMAYIRNALAERTLEIAQFYYARKAYVAAVNRANEIILHYQGAPAVIDALALAIKSYRQLGMNNLADRDLQILLRSYPNAEQAKQFQSEN